MSIDMIAARTDPRLKPCPFCGPGQSIVEVVENEYHQFQIACGRCGTHSGIRPDRDLSLTIEYWNRRPGEELAFSNGQIDAMENG